MRSCIGLGLTLLLLCIFVPPAIALEGKFSGIALDADTWPTGAQKLIYNNPNGCDRLVFDITVGVKFWQFRLYHQYSCNCNPPKACEPPVRAWPLLQIDPFLVQFIDISTSAEFVLPTRHNAPIDHGVEPTILTIPDAFDKFQATNKMRITVDFRPVQFNAFEVTQLSINKWYCTISSTDPDAPMDERDYEFPEEDSNNGLAVRVRRQAHDAPGNPGTQWWWIDRKPPIPPFVVRYYGNNALHRQQTFPDRYTSEVGPAPAWAPSSQQRCPYYCYCMYGGVRVVFYETPTLYEAIYKIPSLNDLKNELAVAGSTKIVTPPNSTYPIQFMFKHLHLGHKVGIDTSRSIAMYVLQPFPLQDLWVRVHDQSGRRLFVEFEVHVPYVDPLAPGQIGWHNAIRWTTASSSATVTVRYNRRHRIGKTQQEIRGRLLLTWINDQGGNTSSFVSPIPPTLLLNNKNFGCVATRDIAGNEEVGRIRNVSVLVGRYGQGWFNKTSIFGDYFNHSVYRPQWEALMRNKTYRFKERLLLTLFTVLKSVSPEDNSTSWFVYFDTFYPDRPTHLPVFYDQETLKRLYGWSEIPRFVSQALDAWAYEYDLLCRILPWLASQVSLFEWQNTRQWVMTNAYDDMTNPWASNTEYLLVPGLNLFRHTGTPNVEIEVEFGNASLSQFVTLRAKNSIAKDEELSLDYQPNRWAKTEYFLTYGAVPDNGKDVATIPEVNSYLYDSGLSRQAIAQELADLHGECYKDGLGRLLTYMGVKLGSMPFTVDGLGSEPDTVDQATKILQAERNVLAAQIVDGQNEYDTTFGVGCGWWPW